jgi:NitT/TauT family transport system substrate-binding protein
VNAVEKNQGRAEAVAAMIKHTRIKEPALYDKMIFPKVAPSGEVRMASLQETLDWFRTKGVVKAVVDLSKVVDQRFTTSALKRLGPFQ